MKYRLERAPGIEHAIERLITTDAEGAAMIVAAILGLADDPRPSGVHVLNEAEGLHRIHLSRLDAVTRRSRQYRVMYRIQDQDLLVVVITVGVLPPAGRRR